MGTVIELSISASGLWFNFLGTAKSYGCVYFAVFAKALPGDRQLPGIE